MLVGIEHNRKADLLQIIDTVRLFRFGFCFTERRQKHACENRDYGDNYQQLDQGERELKIPAPSKLHNTLRISFFLGRQTSISALSETSGGSAIENVRVWKSLPAAAGSPVATL